MQVYEYAVEERSALTGQWRNVMGWVTNEDAADRRFKALRRVNKIQLRKVDRLRIVRRPVPEEPVVIREEGFDMRRADE